MKPYSEACEQNKDPIVRVLEAEFTAAGVRVDTVLEIGSGTGQHAVYFAALLAKSLPRLTWQCSDVAYNLAGIRLWLQEARLRNTPDPLCLDVDREWEVPRFDAVFSANTVHIMSWPQVCRMFTHIGSCLNPGGIFCLYGPFNENGAYTSESNKNFDQWLKNRDPHSGIRDKADLDRLARQHGMQLKSDYTMPANNRLLVWCYSSISSTSA